MNTFFQHRNLYKYTWCWESLGQWSFLDFWIVSADLFQTVLDVHVKRSAELTTTHHLVVCNLRLENPTGSTQKCRSRKSYHINPGGQRYKKDLHRQCFVLVWKGPGIWHCTAERVLSQVQAAEMEFLQRVYDVHFMTKCTELCENHIALNVVPFLWIERSHL